jgi:hypothetical protein
MLGIALAANTIPKVNVPPPVPSAANAKATGDAADPSIVITFDASTRRNRGDRST